MKTKLLPVLTACSVLLLAACGQEENTTSDTNSSEDKLTIYTTIYPFQYFTEAIGGDSISVENVVPPGSDAHSTEMTSPDMIRLAESDAFIHSGTGLEGFVDAAIDAVQNESVLIVDATENLELVDSEEDAHAEEEESHDEHSDEENEEVHEEGNEEGHDEHGDETIDPHVWLDPNRSIIVAENIKNALVELDPNNKEDFEKNFERLKNDLTDLDTEFKEMVSAAESKTFIVSHSAYGYWEEVYGLYQIGISGLSPTDEPSQKELVEIIDLVNENELQYVFFEPNLTNKVATTVTTETDTETLILNNLESISEEDLASGENYLTIMRKNIEALEQGLN